MTNMAPNHWSSIALVVTCTYLCLTVANSAEVSLRLSPDVLLEPPGPQTNVTVMCSVTSSGSQRYYGSRHRTSTVYFVARMRVLVRTENGNWRPIAQLVSVDPRKVHIASGVVVHSVDGSISPDLDVMDSTLTLTWQGPTSDVLNDIRCDAFLSDKGYKGSPQYMYADRRIRDSEINGVKMGEFIETLNDETGRWLQKISGEINQQISTVESTWRDVNTEWKQFQIRVEHLLQRQTESYHQRLKHLEEKVNKFIISRGNDGELVMRLDKIKVLLNETVRGSFLELWPEGQYGLLLPISGCPSDGQTWLKGWLAVPTESTDRNHDHVSDNNHLAAPVLTRHNKQNFVNQRFCSKHDNSSHGPTWPTGSYCVNRVADQCPSGFSEGIIFWHLNDGVGYVNGSHDGFLPDTSGVSKPTKKFWWSQSGDQLLQQSRTMSYCCRRDGPTERAIILPRSKAFYLYRHGGHCQRVAGASVQEESLTFDTNNSENRDRAIGLHPDVELNDLRLFLCYYSFT